MLLGNEIGNMVSNNKIYDCGVLQSIEDNYDIAIVIPFIETSSKQSITIVLVKTSVYLGFPGGDDPV